MTMEYRPEFRGFGKIPRLNRDVVVTEKIDGTNAVICVDEENNMIFAGSKNRWIKEGSDNFGFRTWVMDNKNELKDFLGPGYHYGEWWGLGIQRGYGVDHKRFSLFNTYRWGSHTEESPRPATDVEGSDLLHVVPVLYEGDFDMTKIAHARSVLKINGSVAAPGFMDPEGVVVYHTAGKCLFKYPFKDGAKDLEKKQKENQSE